MGLYVGNARGEPRHCAQAVPPHPRALEAVGPAHRSWLFA